MSASAPTGERDRRLEDEPDAYEAPCIEDVDTESQPAATAAMIQTAPG